MRPAAAVLLACVLAGCATPLQQGERLYQEGDRLGALEVWRGVPGDSPDAEQVRARIGELEAEFDRLVVQYKQRGRYYEAKERLAESILNYRLALKLQPGDAETLAHVQSLARVLATRKDEHHVAFARTFEAGDLAGAREQLATLRSLDPFDPELEDDARDLRGALAEAVHGRMQEGRRGFAAGDIAAARGAFEAVLELDPDNESARGYLSYLATLTRGSGGRGGSVARLAPFATETEIRAEGSYQNALAAERGGDVYAAIRHDLAALAADSEHAAARRHLAGLRRRHSGRVPTLIEAGRAAFRDEDLQSALDHWRRALLIEPGNERVTAYIGRAEQQLQNLEQLRAGPTPGSNR